MKTLLLAAAAVLSIGAASAYAGDGDGASANTQFTLFAGQQPTVANLPKSANLTAQQDPAIHTYITRHSTGTWLFPPASGVGG